MENCSWIRFGDGQLPRSDIWTSHYDCNWKNPRTCALLIQAVSQLWPRLSSYGIWSLRRAHSWLEQWNSNSPGPTGLSIRNLCVTVNQSQQKNPVTYL